MFRSYGHHQVVFIRYICCVGGRSIIWRFCVLFCATICHSVYFLHYGAETGALGPWGDLYHNVYIMQLNTSTIWDIWRRLSAQYGKMTRLTHVWSGTGLLAPAQAVLPSDALPQFQRPQPLHRLYSHLRLIRLSLSLNSLSIDPVIDARRR
jgi:hypothetical protein